MMHPSLSRRPKDNTVHHRVSNHCMVTHPVSKTPMLTVHTIALYISVSTSCYMYTLKYHYAQYGHKDSYAVYADHPLWYVLRYAI